MFMNRAVLAGVYSISMVLGVLTLILPPDSIINIVGLHITYFYGILLLAGGIGALIAIIRKNYRQETIWLWLVFGGYLFYDIALWGVFSDRVGVIDGLAPPFGPALGILALALFTFGKALSLQKRNRELIKASDNDRLG